MTPRNSRDVYSSMPGHKHAIVPVLVSTAVFCCRWAIGKEFTLDLDPFLILILTLSVIHAHFVSSGDFLCKLYAWRVQLCSTEHAFRVRDSEHLY